MPKTTYPTLRELRKKYPIGVCILGCQPDGLPRGVVLTHCYYGNGHNYSHVLARRGRD